VIEIAVHAGDQIVPLHNVRFVVRSLVPSLGASSNHVADAKQRHASAFGVEIAGLEGEAVLHGGDIAKADTRPGRVLAEQTVLVAGNEIIDGSG